MSQMADLLNCPVGNPSSGRERGCASPPVASWHVGLTALLLTLNLVGPASAKIFYRCPDGPLESLVNAFSAGSPSTLTCVYRGSDQTRETRIAAENRACRMSAIDLFAHGPDFTVHTCKGDQDRCYAICE